MTTKTKAVAAPSASDVERSCLEQIARAREIGAQCGRDVARARAAFERAEAARRSAVDAEIRGEKDAAQQIERALSAAREAAERVAAAQERGDACRRVRTAAETRLAQVREVLLDELTPDALELTAAAVAARDALREPLSRYQAAWAAAQRRWRELTPGVRARVLQQDAKRGQTRDDSLVSRDASCPPMPLDPADLAKLLSIAPVPPLLAPAEPDTPEIADDAPRPLFAGDDGWEQHTLGTSDAPAETPIWPPSHVLSGSELIRAQMKALR
jgi:hypothetical protein